MKYILIITLILTNLYSAPARGGVREFTQADGTTFKATAKGNQHLNWIESADGEILKYNPQTKNYELAEIKYNNLAPSGQIYKNSSQRAIQKSPMQNIQRVDKTKMYQLWQKRQTEHRKKMGYDKHQH